MTSILELPFIQTSNQLSVLVQVLMGRSGFLGSNLNWLTSSNGPLVKIELNLVTSTGGVPGISNSSSIENTIVVRGNSLALW